MPAASSGRGSRRPGYADADGPTGVQPPSSSATPPRPTHGAWAEPLRPACASWMPAAAPRACRKSTMRDQARCCSSFHRPVSAGEIRPSGSTAVASVSTSPAPPRANEPRCTRCQSSGTPSTAEYWHIGATHTRLRTVRSRRVIGRNSWLNGAPRGGTWAAGRLSRPNSRDQRGVPSSVSVTKPAAARSKSPPWRSMACRPPSTSTSSTSVLRCHPAHHGPRAGRVGDPVGGAVHDEDPAPGEVGCSRWRRPTG